MKKYQIFILIAILLMTVTALIGVINHGTEPYRIFTNLYDQKIELFNSGIYKHDSAFKATIFIGTDWAFLVVVLPLSIVLLILDIAKKLLTTKLLLLGSASTMAYQFFSQSFGLMYNPLLLVYILGVTFSLFSIIFIFESILKDKQYKELKGFSPWKSSYIFLFLSFFSLIAAWVPEIASALINKEPVPLIQHYTTEVTYIIDLGIIVPMIIWCIALVIKHSKSAFILLSALSFLSTMIGIIVIFQTVVQIAYDITFPIPVLIIKVGLFVVLAGLGLLQNIRITRTLSF